MIIMPLFGIGAEKKTSDEIQEEIEYTKEEVELLKNKAELQELRKKLKANGLSLQSFGNSIIAAYKWAKSH